MSELKRVVNLQQVMSALTVRENYEGGHSDLMFDFNDEDDTKVKKIIPLYSISEALGCRIVSKQKPIDYVVITSQNVVLGCPPCGCTEGRRNVIFIMTKSQLRQRKSEYPEVFKDATEGIRRRNKFSSGAYALVIRNFESGCPQLEYNNGTDSYVLVPDDSYLLLSFLL